MEDQRDGDRLLKSGEVARLFGVGPTTVSKWASRGLLPIAGRTPGGQYRYWESEVVEMTRRVRNGVAATRKA